MRRGFTLAELVIVVGLVVGLVALTTISLLRPQHQADTASLTATLMADLRQRQLLAMEDSANSYGVQLETNQYTLFRGATYSPADPANFTIAIADGLQLSSSFPAGTIVFQAGSGEVADQGSITITHSASGITSTLVVNAYGTVAQVN